MYIIIICILCTKYTIESNYIMNHRITIYSPTGDSPSDYRGTMTVIHHGINHQ